MWEFEKKLYAQGINLIAGVDEVGRGPLAGPVVAAAVIVPKNYNFKNKVTDSKKLSPHQRSLAFTEITGVCSFAYAKVSEKEIDRENIFQATLKAMAQAIEKLTVKPEWVLIDGPHAPVIPLPSSAIINGDAKSISIAAASIVAKVIRDDLMREYDRTYPEYGFAAHKGYGTKAHQAAILKHGPCPIHRRSFQPIKGMVEQKP